MVIEVIATNREIEMTTAALTIKASTTTEAIEAAIQFLDMRAHAIELRDMAAAVIDEQGDQVVAELHEIDGIAVLWSPVFEYAYVNEAGPGIGDSLLIGNGECPSPGHAVAWWKLGESPVGLQVEAGQGEDHDTGHIEAVADARTVFVAWDSGVKTPAGISALKVI